MKKGLKQMQQHERVMEQKPFEKRESMKNHKSKRNFLMPAMFFIAFCCISVCSFAQDIIILKNGTEIQTLVQEVGTDEVKYKKFDNPNGPNYTLKKLEIFMIRYANGSKDVFQDEVIPVIPKNETKSVIQQENKQNNTELLSIKNSFWTGQIVTDSYGDKLSQHEIRNLIRTVPEALSIYNKGRTFKTVGRVLDGIGAGLIIVGLVDMANHETDYSYYNDYYSYYSSYTGYWAWYGAGFACALTGSIFYFVGNSKIASSVRIYNNTVLQQHRKSELSLNFGITRSGGIGFTFNF